LKSEYANSTRNESVQEKARHEHTPTLERDR
jgi:hypothetical protein